MTTKTPETVTSASSSPFPIVELFSGPVASTVSQNSEALAKGMQVVPSEIGEFVAARIKANVEHYGQCTKCTDWSDLMELQQKWFKDTSKAYTDQANTVTAMTQAMFDQASDAPSTADIKESVKTNK